MCDNKCKKCSCENAATLLSYEVCEDGSAIATFDFSEKLIDILVEKGVNAILKEYIDEQLKGEN